MTQQDNEQSVGLPTMGVRHNAKVIRWSMYFSPNFEFVLCPCRLPDHPGQRKTLYAHKYPRWWLQSFLAGVSDIVLGGRDQQGNLKDVRINIEIVPVNILFV